MLRMPSARGLVGDLADALLVGRVLRQVLHEAAVELEEGRVEVRQQLERIQADAELLQSHAATRACATRLANSCAARRLVKTLASGNCSTRYSPPTLVRCQLLADVAGEAVVGERGLGDLHQQRGGLSRAAGACR